jgi:hypothetical protein
MGAGLAVAVLAIPSTVGGAAAEARPTLPVVAVDVAAPPDGAAVVELPTAMTGSPAPSVSVSDATGEKLAAQLRPVADGGAPLALVVGAGESDSPEAVGAAKNAAVELLFRLGTDVRATVVVTGAEPRVVARPDDGLATAVRAVGEAWPRGGSVSAAALVAAKELSAEPDVPRILVAVVTGHEPAPGPASELASSLLGARTVPYVVAPRTDAEYWAPVVERTGGKLLPFEDGQGAPAADVADVMSRQHVVSFRASNDLPEEVTVVVRGAGQELRAQVPLDRSGAISALSPRPDDGGRQLDVPLLVAALLTGLGGFTVLLLALRRRPTGAHAGWGNAAAHQRTLPAFRHRALDADAARGRSGRPSVPRHGIPTEYARAGTAGGPAEPRHAQWLPAAVPPLPRAAQPAASAASVGPSSGAGGDSTVTALVEREQPTPTDHGEAGQEVAPLQASPEEDAVPSGSPSAQNGAARRGRHAAGGPADGASHHQNGHHAAAENAPARWASAMPLTSQAASRQLSSALTSWLLAWEEGDGRPLQEGLGMLRNSWSRSSVMPPVSQLRDGVAGIERDVVNGDLEPALVSDALERLLKTVDGSWTDEVLLPPIASEPAHLAVERAQVAAAEGDPRPAEALVRTVVGYWTTLGAAAEDGELEQAVRALIECWQDGVGAERDAAAVQALVGESNALAERVIAVFQSRAGRLGDRAAGLCTELLELSTS